MSHFPWLEDYPLATDGHWRLVDGDAFEVMLSKCHASKARPRLSHGAGITADRFEASGRISFGFSAETRCRSPNHGRSADRGCFSRRQCVRNSHNVVIGSKCASSRSSRWPYLLRCG